MALWFRLNINLERIGVVEIRRRGQLDLSDPVAIANVRSTYDVRRNGHLVGQVTHRYGDGAWRLVAHAADLIAQEARRQALADSDGFCDIAMPHTHGIATIDAREDA